MWRADVSEGRADDCVRIALLTSRNLLRQAAARAMPIYAVRPGGKTLRELATAETGHASCLPLVGTHTYVAALMAEAMDEIGEDGFLLTTPIQHLSRRYLTDITDITEGLIPALRDLGRVRDSYEHATLRENLLAF